MLLQKCILGTSQMYTHIPIMSAHSLYTGLRPTGCCCCWQRSKLGHWGWGWGAGGGKWLSPSHLPEIKHFLIYFPKALNSQQVSGQRPKTLPSSSFLP